MFGWDNFLCQCLSGQIRSFIIIVPKKTDSVFEYIARFYVGKRFFFIFENYFGKKKDGISDSLINCEATWSTIHTSAIYNLILSISLKYAMVFCGRQTLTTILYSLHSSIL